MPSHEDLALVLAKRVKNTRERQGHNQAKLAELSGLTPAAISQIEAGDRVPAFKTLVVLAKALQTTPNDLMGLGGEATDPTLRGLFRDLQDMSSSDLDKVKDFARYIHSQSKGEST